ncbi:UBX domain-containing protein 4 [Chionoecetes opilio]|uniref:UBX domain-containing protein 4 n=1 Tax=Chionoecetes opilio TaxID=41210 RepID=A0A8J4Y9S2_CHIOP|nr:UBX domain-containing protein 4 [Chionoecetes opilio]
MNWFEGSIPQAIAAAKNGKAIFVVYVRDSSEASKTTDEVLSQQDVVKALGGGHFVAIKLDNGTEDAKQFSQIYPLVLVPSLFFISGETGVPLEVLGGPLTSESLKQKINKLTTEAKPVANTSSPSPSASGISNTAEDSGGSASDQAEAAKACAAPPTATTEEVKAKSEDAKPVPEAASKDQEAPAAEASGTSNMEGSSSEEPSLDDKVDRAKTLLADKQYMTAKEKAEEIRQKEISRRKMGQDVAKKRQKQEDDEIKAAARERRKDKEDDRIARERVKAQIAADRAEREAHAAVLRGEEPPASQAAAAAAPTPPSAPASNISRLKFRLPDGSSAISQFPAEAPLSEVRQYIEQNLDLPFSTFTLASTVQPRPFTPEDHTTSLRDLGLVPSAILAILPSASSGPGRLVSTGGTVWDILWLLLTPITFLYGFLQDNLLGRRGQPTERTGEPRPKRARGDQSPNSQQRPAT